MAKIAVVEDNDAMRAQLCGFIAQYAQESGHQLDVTAFSDGAQLVEPYRPGFDIIFLDIEMPKLGGMPTAERIRRQDPDVVLVFVTNMAQYAIRGYEVDALDFVLKPVSYYQFSTKLERAFGKRKPAIALLYRIRIRSAHNVTTCRTIYHLTRGIQQLKIVRTIFRLLTTYRKHFRTSFVNRSETVTYILYFL